MRYDWVGLLVFLIVLLVILRVFGLIWEKAMKDAAIRALRTFFQGVVGVLVIQAIPPLTDIVLGNDLNLDVFTAVGRAALAGGIIALISFLHNEFEDRTDTNVGPK